MSGRGKILPSQEAYDWLLYFRQLVTPGTEAAAVVGGPPSAAALGKETAPRHAPSKFLAEIYEIAEMTTLDVLPPLTRRAVTQPTLYMSAGHGQAPVQVFSSADAAAAVDDDESPSSRKRPHDAMSSLEQDVNNLIMVVASLLPQYPGGIHEAPLAKRLRKMGYEPPPSLNLPNLLSAHGFRVEGNKIFAAEHIEADTQTLLRFVAGHGHDGVRYVV